MIKVKVTTPWNHTNYESRLPANQIPNNQIPANYQFFFNDNSADYDIWIVWGGLTETKTIINCARDNLIYLTDEIHEQRSFNQKFLNQFAAVITCRTDLQHDRIIHTHELNTWVVDRSFDELFKEDYVEKTKTISVVCSDQTWLKGHKERYAFVNKLIGHFKDRLDVYGRGFNEIKDKYDALAPYKYSIAIENSSIPGYFTEKITDCFLTHTLPLYFGCQDIDTYFNSEAYQLIDIHDYKRAIREIEKLLEEDPYSSRLNAIKQAKEKYLFELQIFSALPTLLDRHFKGAEKQKKQKCILRSENEFVRGRGINRLIGNTFKFLRLPRRFYFEIYKDQSKTYANRPK
jgi:hypothetical protein